MSARAYFVYMKRKQVHNGGAPLQIGWVGEESLNKVIIFVFFAHKNIIVAS